MFSRDALLSFSSAKKIIKAAGNSQLRVFVVDDTVKTRRGKKMPGVSIRFDHLTSRCVMRQQVLTLGLASDTQLVPSKP